MTADAKKSAAGLRRARLDPMGPPLQQCDRVFVRHRGRRLVYFGGCDYFRLACHPAVLAATHDAIDRHGLNVAASRATTGNHPVYATLERALARFFGSERAVLVPSGYTTNLIAVQALAPEITHALIDDRAHASLADAARGLGCPARSFRHRDPADLESKVRRLGRGARLLVLTDGLFARDGSIAPLARYLDALPASGRLLVDDAHGAGVLGARGRGTPEHCGVRSDQIIQTGTLSKAFGAYGGVVLADEAVIGRIASASQQFAGSTPLPPPLAAAALAALEVLGSDPGCRTRLWGNVRRVKVALRESGLAQADTPCPVVSVEGITPQASQRLRLALLRHQIYPNLIRYPGGPSAGYFRFALSSEHTPEQLDALVTCLQQSRGLRSLAQQQFSV